MGIIKSGEVSNVLGLGRVRQLRIKKGKDFSLFFFYIISKLKRRFKKAINIKIEYDMLTVTETSTKKPRP